MIEVAKKKSPPPRSLGPVADLEQHLPVDWWKSLFNATYLKTDGDVVENNANTKMEIDTFLAATGIKPSDAILDLCCGQGRHLLELAKRGYTRLFGVDRSRYLIRLAKRRAQSQHLNIKFSEGDARSVRMPQSSLDCVALFGNSFGYFEKEEDDLKVLKGILRILKGEGRLVMDIVNGEWMRNHFEPRSWEWLDGNHFVCRERSLSQDKSRIISREVVVDSEKGVLADQFYAERIYNYSDIKRVLETLGFRNITLFQELMAESTRNQDLGMMANRLFITAIAPPKAAHHIPLSKKTSVAVLLGDPTKDDSVKRNGKFNPEDIETVNRLKNELNYLPEYSFSYYDKHDSLLEDIRKKKHDLVFNLCDEGFQNDAKMELHVPAILEMLRIPYSGAGPACLATCYNKHFVNALAQQLDIAVPLETYYDPNDQSAHLPSIFPALIKPNLGDSSIGITQHAVVKDSETLMSYITELKEQLPNIPILIQEFLQGPEYTVGVIGNSGNYSVLPILTVDYSKLPEDLPPILGYESKWIPGSPYWDLIKYKPAQLTQEKERYMTDASISLFERLGCRDYARFDFREDAQGKIKLLEVNPNPGWCWDGKMNLMAELGGKSYRELLASILDAAMVRLSLKGQE